MLTQLETIYADYAAAVKKVRKNARMFDGFLGLGKDPRNDACHDAYYQAVGTWVEEFLATEPAQEVLMQAAMYILQTPTAYNGQECYWYMYAAHGHIKPMIPLLSQENCAALGSRMEQLYRKRDRMPLQKELLKMLAKAAKG